MRILVNQVVESFSNVDPLLVRSSEEGIVIDLYAFTVKVERQSNQLVLFTVFKLAKWTNNRVIFLVAQLACLVKNLLRGYKILYLLDVVDVLIVFIRLICLLLFDHLPGVPFFGRIVLMDLILNVEVESS